MKFSFMYMYYLHSLHVLPTAFAISNSVFQNSPPKSSKKTVSKRIARNPKKFSHTSSIRTNILLSGIGELSCWFLTRMHYNSEKKLCFLLTLFFGGSNAESALVKDNLNLPTFTILPVLIDCGWTIVFV